MAHPARELKEFACALTLTNTSGGTTPPSTGWIDDRMAKLRRDFLPGDLAPELEAAGIDGCIAVQARQTFEETGWLLQLADEHSFIAGVVGWVDLQSPTADADLERIAKHPKLVGVRHVLQDEPDEFFERPAFRRGVARLERFDLTYDLLIYGRQLPAAVKFVAPLPNQRFVLDHMGKPDIRGGQLEPWRTELRRLAAFPNVWCKLSGLVTEAEWNGWTPDDLRPYLDAAAEAFGPKRLMIGSDWPVCTLAARYMRVMGVVMDYIATWPAADREAVLGGTAERLWNLKASESDA